MLISPVISPVTGTLVLHPEYESPNVCYRESMICALLLVILELMLYMDLVLFKTLCDHYALFLSMRMYNCSRCPCSGPSPDVAVF